MELAWHDTVSFQRHLEKMKEFRRWHTGKQVLVPLWQIIPPRNSQN